MAENPFVEKIASLKAGEISELIVEQNEFFQFRDAWISLPDRGNCWRSGVKWTNHLSLPKRGRIVSAKHHEI